MVIKDVGSVEVVVTNRRDGTPVLSLTADGEDGCEVLSRIEASLNQARVFAVMMGMADVYDLCECKEKLGKIIGLEIPMALGGIGLMLSGI